MEALCACVCAGGVYRGPLAVLERGVGLWESFQGPADAPGARGVRNERPNFAF